MADGITISIDSLSLSILIFMMYKIIQLEYRVKKIEEFIARNSENEVVGKG